MTLLSREDCIGILTKTFKNLKVSLVKYEFKIFSDTPLGFLAEHYLLVISYTFENEKTPREESYFVKCLPRNNQDQRDFLQATGTFKKEVDLLQKLIHQLESVASEMFSPKFYLTKDDVIVFENLQTKGFRMPDKVYLDKPKIKAVLKTMAVMHAAGLILEEKKRAADQNNNYTLISECEKELSDYKYDFQEGHERNNWFKASANCVAKLCEYFTGTNKYEEKLLHYLKYVMPNLDDLLTKVRYVLCHHDLWTNNIMFNNENQCRFVDFQLASYCPPALDLWIFLYFNTERLFLRANRREFASFYYENLSLELAKSGLNVANILPKNLFDINVEEYAKPMLFQVCVGSTYIYAGDEFSKNVMQDSELYEDFNFGDRSKYVLEEIKKSEFCESRFRNVILPLCEMFD